MADIQEKTQAETDKTLGSINRSLEEDITIEKAKKAYLSYVNLSNISINPDLFGIITEDMARKALLVPFFKVGKKLRVAVFDPNFQETKNLIEELKQQNYQINVCLASSSAIKDVLKQYGDNIEEELEDFDTTIDEENLDYYNKEIGSLASSIKEKCQNLSSAELLNMLLVGAIKTKASDIHLEPKKDKLLIRYRIDGMLQDILSIEEDKVANLITQAKHKAKMKLNVTTRPQDGRFFFIINDKEVDVRVSALPTPFGEDIVIRVLDSRNRNFNINSLGLEDINAESIFDAIKKPYGMILTTGPTGSGKTTTLYSLLKDISTSEKKVITIEDPIEYKLDGITQSQISEEEHYTFENGLRSVLRQDPDVIMVGEIRDLPTAETAAQAALTGHKVLSTLHTNDAVGAIDRLVNMGLEPFMIAPSLDTVIAQRLVRKCCDKCSTEISLTQAQKDIIYPIISRLNTILIEKLEIPEFVKKIKGCEECSFTGYKGRIGLYEVIRITDEVKEMILKRASASEIRHLVRKSSFSVFEAGIIKVIKKQTTIEEVIRVSKIGE